MKNQKSILLAVPILLLAWSAAIAEEKGKPLTNADVIKMLAAKIPESVIVSKIQAGEVNFDTSTDAIIELNKKGVGEKVLNAMLKPKDGLAEGAKSPDLNPAGAVKPPGAPALAPGDKPSTLSYGTATGLVKKGVTTQLEILELFGGADTMTTDKDGTEVWMYDKKTSTVSSTAKQNSAETRKSEAEVMAFAFGIPLVGGFASAKAKGKEDTKTETESAGTVTHSVKTITFIIKFNANKTVKDCAIRQASY